MSDIYYICFTVSENAPPENLIAGINQLGSFGVTSDDSNPYRVTDIKNPSVRNYILQIEWPDVPTKASLCQTLATACDFIYENLMNDITEVQIFEGDTIKDRAIACRAWLYAPAQINDWTIEND